MAPVIVTLHYYAEINMHWVGYGQRAKRSHTEPPRSGIYCRLHKSNHGARTSLALSMRAALLATLMRYDRRDTVEMAT